LREYVAQTVEEKLSLGNQLRGQAWLECAGELAHFNEDLTRISHRWFQAG